MIYVSTNTDLQVIDTVDLPMVHSIDYTLHVSTPSNDQLTHFNIIHDGIEIGELQESMIQSNTIPLEFSSNISNYIGQILFQPTESNTQIIIEKNIRYCNLYSESTKSGKLIYDTQGVGIDLESSLKNMSIRYNNYNFYGDPYEYISVDTYNYLGPEKTKEELLTSEWISFNNSDLENLTAISSGQNPNFQYQEFNVDTGYAYAFTCNAYYQVAEEVVVKEQGQRQQGQCFIKIGKTPGSSEYINQNLEEAENDYFLQFVPEGPFYVSFGFGDRSNKATLINPSLKQIVPFHSWNKDKGTIFLKWDALSVPDDIFLLRSDEKAPNIRRFSNTQIGMRSFSNSDIWILGPEQSINKLAIAYDGNEYKTCLNGNTIISNTQTEMLNVFSSYFNENVTQFSYIPTVLSDEQLMSITNV